jgi:arginyl-tRNA synthetase
MSKRKGEFITLDELIKEVGKDAARFFFINISPDTHLDFDLELAKEKSPKNPVYYMQYAYVRAINIIRKTTKQLKPRIKNPADLETPNGVVLAKFVVRWPEILEDTAKDYHVHRLTKYGLELAHAFHNFYEKERILGENNKDLAATRLALVIATVIVLKNLFGVLGIATPKKM